MFEKQKLEIISTEKRRNKFPMGVNRHYRYATLKTGLMILLHLADHKNVTIKQLVELTGKDNKTIRRLLAVLEDVGVPLIVEYKSNGIAVNVIHLSLDPYWTRRIRERIK